MKIFMTFASSVILVTVAACGMKSQTSTTASDDTTAVVDSPVMKSMLTCGGMTPGESLNIELFSAIDAHRSDDVRGTGSLLIDRKVSNAADKTARMLYTDVSVEAKHSSCCVGGIEVNAVYRLSGAEGKFSAKLCGGNQKNGEIVIGGETLPLLCMFTELAVP